MLAPLLEPGVARRQRHHLGLGDHRHGLEVEGGERLSGGQARLGHVAFNAPAAAIGEFVLGKGGKEAGRRPALLVGLRGELGPHQLDARQAQFGQQQLEAGGVDGVRGCHAAASRLKAGPTARTAASSS